MKNSPLCQQCQAPLPANSPEGLCPKCLVQVGMEDSIGGMEETSGAEALPKVEEIAEHFPHLEIIKLIGHGGMGFVYKARQPGLDRLVCLKILSPKLGRERSFAERFIREAKAMARLNHPNIISVHDFGITGGFFYFVMEFIDGMDLWQLEHAKRLLPGEALAIVSQICDALQYAHDEGVIHRDIKPGNILIDKKGRVKIADFGLAKLLRQEHQPHPKITQSRIVMGTPHYMAPEQTEKPTEVDHRADIYSMGVVFYEMLTGELPIGRFAPPSQKAALDVRIDDVVLRALEKDPQQRYQKAGEVKNRVDTILQKMGTGETRVATETTTRSWKRGKEYVPWVFAAVNFICVLALWWRLEHPPSPTVQNANVAPLAVEKQPTAGLVSQISEVTTNVPSPAPEFRSLFNGQDLAGWKGNSEYWSVENGSIVAQSPPDAPLNFNTCLVWEGGQIADCELKFQFRAPILKGNVRATGGVIYRGRRVRESDLSGYECRVTAGGHNLGVLTSRERMTMISFCQKTSVRGDERKNDRLSVHGDLAPFSSIQKVFKKEDWNECVIVVRGNRFTHSINGLMVADLTDENEHKRQMSGFLGLMLNPGDGRAARMEYKNIQLRHLPSETAVTNLPASLVTNPIPAVAIAYANKASIVIDNTEAIFEGSWTTAAFSPDRYDKDYKFTSTTIGGAQSIATYRPTIKAAGKYYLDIWYSQGPNRAVNSAWTVSCQSGTFTNVVDQRINGGRWVRISEPLEFAAGTDGFVRLNNATGNHGAVVVADAVRFVPIQEEP